MKQLTAFLLALVLLVMTASAGMILEEQDTEEVDASVFTEGEVAIAADAVSIAAPSAILIEKSTGKVLFEKDADLQLEPASVTKVMTILLIVEAVEAGAISLDDPVPVSGYAASMGGSQIYLEEGETMRGQDMLKAIVISSANDAAVAMAEYIAGTEQAFVEKMNARAAELEMTNTKFCNCTGLLDQPEHLTTARDISRMSRELIRHDWIKEYTTIWMDTVRDGAFGLSNTNKMIRYYDGATGLKTGFTQRAGYCLAATAERSGVEYIAVVMKCATTGERFESAKTLLSFAFANYTVIPSAPETALAPIAVTLGEKRYIQPVPAYETDILIEKTALQSVIKTVEVETQLEAPVSEGQQVGTLKIEAGDAVLAEIPIVAGEASLRLTWGEILLSLLKTMYAGT